MVLLQKKQDGKGIQKRKPGHPMCCYCLSRTRIMEYTPFTSKRSKKKSWAFGDRKKRSYTDRYMEKAKRDFTT